MNCAPWFLPLCVSTATWFAVGLWASAKANPVTASQVGDSELVAAMITFRDTPGVSEQALVSSLGGQIKYTYDLVPTIAAWLPEQAVATLRVNPGVVRVEPDVQVFTLDSELSNSWGVGHIGADAAHASGNKGAGVKVGIIDSGIDHTHPELAAHYAGGWDFVNNDSDPQDDYGHGTKVAGIVGAADDGAGIVGVAPEADLHAYKVFDAAGHGRYSDIIAALSRAVLDGIDVVNMSFGSQQDPGQTFQAACDNAAAAGLLLVSSAGNFGTFDGSGDTIAYPAHYSSVLAVGATVDTDDQRAFFSSTGAALDLMAPGFEIYTTDLFGGYVYETGTSMAAPYVTGTAALFLHNGVPDVRMALTSTAIDLGPVGFDTQYGYGLVDARTAVPVPSALGLALIGLLLIPRRLRSGT